MFFIGLLAQFCNFLTKLELSRYYTKDSAIHRGGYMFTVGTFSADSDFKQESFPANIKNAIVFSQKRLR